MRLGVISNLRSQQNLRHIGRFRQAVEAGKSLPYAELNGVEGLTETLQDFARRGVDHIVLNSGDGTVIACLTEIFRKQIFEQAPTLVVLPGGMTNMIAKDAGHSGRPDRGIKKLLKAQETGQPLGKYANRSIIAMRLTAEAEPIYGMFIGTAAVYRAIIYTRKEVHTTGLESDGAAAVTLLSFFLKRFLGRIKDDPIGGGDHIKAVFDDGAIDEGEHLLSIVTTLHKLVLGSRPFWGENQPGALRYTRVSHPAPRLLLNAPRILFGFPNRHPKPPDAYFSRKAHRVELHMTAPFTLDGELFEPTPGEPVRLSAGHSARFLKF